MPDPGAAAGPSGGEHGQPARQRQAGSKATEGSEEPVGLCARLGRRRGGRLLGCLGKGGGFSDLEFALLVEAGLIGPGTVVATTVHPLQVLEEPLPETDHDFRLDLIVAGEEVIACRRARRPRGILWEHLDPAKVAAISALSAQAPGRATSTP